MNFKDYEPNFRPRNSAQNSWLIALRLARCKALRALSSLRALLIYPVFDDKSQMGETKISQAKDCINKTTGLI